MFNKIGRMFQRNDQQYLINAIPKFELSLSNLDDLYYYDEILDVRGKEDFFLDHISRPKVCFLLSVMEISRSIQIKTRQLTILTKSEQQNVKTQALQDELLSNTKKLKYIR